MDWPYHFLDLEKNQVHQRRIILDRYAVYAQLSAVIPVLVFQLYLLGKWVFVERQRIYKAYSTVPSSPIAKKFDRSSSGSILRLWRSTVWWLEGEVAPGWGLRLHWFAGMIWTTWLLFLCVHDTGEDYLHITKRFGIIAASQFPLHYMLSMKSLYSPLAFAFRTSHEHLNPWHRVLGRIIFFLLTLHACWYINFFVQAELYDRFTKYFVIIGIIAFLLLAVVVSTSLDRVRRWSYRVFFVLHLAIGVSILPLLFFHAKPLRVIVLQSFVLFAFDIACRKLDTFTGLATITSIPHTKLVIVQVPVPLSKIHKFQVAPGSHVYLSLPQNSVPGKTSLPLLHELLFNPFTVADVSATDITLVLRTLRGPTTKALHHCAKQTRSKPLVNIEGPLGTSRRLPKLARKFDRVLLVAGGVGGTYALPIYHALQEQLEAEARSPDRLTFNWSMRSAAEATWAVDLPQARSLQEDENVKIFVTRSRSENVRYDAPVPEDGSVEMDQLRRNEEPIEPTGGRGRPDLRKIVDDVFRYGNEERVAVLFCGPQDMARELRDYVGRWVAKGRYVWWHDESFGW